MDPDLKPFSLAFSWGENDCCLAVADCLVAMGLPDPMTRYRGRYSSARGALRMFAPEGGLDPAMTARMAELGYIEDPGGFVGLIETDLGPTACLKIGRYWYAKSERGAQGYSQEHVYKIWSYPCQQQSQ